MKVFGKKFEFMCGSYFCGEISLTINKYNRWIASARNIIGYGATPEEAIKALITEMMASKIINHPDNLLDNKEEAND
jgi:hypothetical protein